MYQIHQKEIWATSNHLQLPNGEVSLAGVYTCQFWPDKSREKAGGAVSLNTWSHSKEKEQKNRQRKRTGLQLTRSVHVCFLFYSWFSALRCCFQMNIWVQAIHHGLIIKRQGSGHEWGTPSMQASYWNRSRSARVDGLILEAGQQQWREKEEEEKKRGEERHKNIKGMKAKRQQQPDKDIQRLMISYLYNTASVI